jgi:hypothetical protein
MTKKKCKRSDADVETAAAVVAVAERAERGVGVRIGDHLTVAQMRALEEARASGSPPGTTILGGRVISLTNPVEGIEQPQGETEQTQAK